MEKTDMVKYVTAGSLVIAALGYAGYKIFFKHETKEEVNVSNEAIKMFIDKNLEKIVELTRDEANERSKIVSGVHYDLVLSFFQHETEFEGYIRVTFTLSEVSNYAFLNFEGKQLYFCTINGEAVPTDKEIFNDHMIHLPKDMLKVGENVVDVRYTGIYRRDGVGLHRYEDPEDGEMYLYTLFESFCANKCFP